MHINLWKSDGSGKCKGLIRSLTHRETEANKTVNDSDGADRRLGRDVSTDDHANADADDHDHDHK